MIVAHVLNAREHKQVRLVGKEVTNAVFDSATFAASVVLLLGFVDNAVLTALGSTKPFLLVAGLAGACYGVYVLVPNNSNGNGNSKNSGE